MKNNIITAGVDEVGRGCLAGPVVSAAVILNNKIDLELIKDSKKINFENRLKIAAVIKENSYYGIGVASVEEIFEINILQAALLSMKRAVDKLSKKPGLILIDNNRIREHVTINPGTIGGGGITKIGNNCLLMIGAHIAHDCLVGDNVIIANNAAIAGHAIISDNVVIGGNCGVQQFTRIGKFAMVGGMTGVSSDVIPYGLTIGNRNYLNGINVIGLRRKKIENKYIIELTNAYKEIFKTENLNENLSKINGKFNTNIFVKEIIDFINEDKKRPICTPFMK